MILQKNEVSVLIDLNNGKIIRVCGNTFTLILVNDVQIRGPKPYQEIQGTSNNRS